MQKGEPTTTSRLPDSSAGEKKKATIKLLNSSVFIQPVGSPVETAVEGLRELQNGDSITTNETGEGALEFDSCRTIYVYQQSSFRRGACPKFDAQLGDNYCTAEGTTAFKDCASKLITQSNSATVTLLGTWASHTYVSKRELSIVILFEGSAEVTPVTDTRERTLGKSQVIPAEHFWFSVPDNRLKELAALNIGLEPRTVYPFKKLAQLLDRGDLRDLPIESVVKQAIKDNAAKPGDLEGVTHLPPRVPEGETGRNGPDPGGPGGPHRGGPRHGGGVGPTLEADVVYDHTKVGREAIKQFPARNGVLLRRNSVSLIPASSPFRVIPGASPSAGLSVAYAPKSKGHHTGTLSFKDRYGRQYLYRLSGDASTSSLQLSSNSISFSGEKTRTDRLQLKSNGEVSAEIGKISLANNPEVRFKITSDTCSNRVLNKNEQCEIVVEHTRVVADLDGTSKDAAQLLLDHDAPSTPMFVAVSAPVLPTLGIAEGLSFGSIPIPGLCDKILTLSNNADTPLTIGKADLDRIKSEGFTITEDACSNTTLAPQGKTICRIKVRFEPSLTAAQKARLIVPHVSANGSMSRSVTLSGQGDDPILKLTPDTAFGALQLGSSQKIEKILVERMRGPALEIKRVEISGPGKTDFEVHEETCTKQPISKSCEVLVGFKPTAEGLRRAEITLVGPDQTVISRSVLGAVPNPLATSRATPSPVQPVSQATDNASPPNAKSVDGPCAPAFPLKLEGKGYAAWSVDTSSLCFGGKSVLKGVDPKPRTLQLHFKSQSREPLSPSYSISGDSHEDFSVVSKKCDELIKSCTLDITFTPKSTDKRRAKMSLAPNAITPATDIELFGRGQSPNPFKRFGRWVVGLFTDESAKACRR